MIPLKVMFDTRSRHWQQNPYIELLTESVSPGVEVIGFSWHAAIFGRYDAVHFHWPEYLTQHRIRALRIVARILLVCWMLRLKVQKKPIVRTVHNLSPHSSVESIIDRMLLSWVQKTCQSEVWLQNPELSGHSINDAMVVIPHGDYTPWIDKTVESWRITSRRKKGKPSKTRFLCFGILKEYKNIHEPIRAVRSSQLQDVSLLVMGSAPDPSYLETLYDSAGQDPRIEIFPERVDDALLVKSILSSDYVVVPYPKMFNSGVVLLALSLGRRVVVSENEVTVALQREFGKQWVYTYPGSFDRHVVQSLHSHTHDIEDFPVWSTGRSWSVVGSLHIGLYSSLCR